MENLTIGQLLDEIEAAIRIEAIKWSSVPEALNILLLNHRKFGLLLLEKYAGRELSEYMALDDIAESEGCQAFAEINRLHGRAMRLTLNHLADDAHDAKSRQH
jgi:hypothetical protein